MKEIHAIFAPGQTFVTVETEWQYDSGYNLFIDGLELPSYYEVDFCNEGDLQTVTIPGDAAGVRIPDVYFLSGKCIKAYTVIVDADGIETRCQVTINVRGRPERSDIDPPPVEQQQIDTLIDKMNTAVDNAEASAEESERQAELSEGNALDSEAWATGKRDGVDVDSDDPTYHNNAKYYAEHSGELIDSINYLKGQTAFLPNVKTSRVDGGTLIENHLAIKFGAAQLGYFYDGSAERLNLFVYYANSKSVSGAARVTHYRLYEKLPAGEPYEFTIENAPNTSSWSESSSLFKGRLSVSGISADSGAALDIRLCTVAYDANDNELFRIYSEQYRYTVEDGVCTRTRIPTAPTSRDYITDIGLVKARNSLEWTSCAIGSDVDFLPIVSTDQTYQYRFIVPDSWYDDAAYGYCLAIRDGGKKTYIGPSFQKALENGGSITVDDEISGASENPVQNKVIKAALDEKGTYSKPSGGIPKTDLASAVQTSLGKADSAYQKPGGGIPDTDIASAATWNAKGTYNKPGTGIPKTDLASDVQTSLGKADTALQEHQSLAAYRTAAAQDVIDARIETEALGAYPVNTASGSVATFPDGADGIPVKALTVAITPVQSGSGDPAPDNVRPISGWTGVTVTRCGKNLFPISRAKKSASNLWIGSDAVNAAPDGSFVLPAGTYTFSASESQNGLYVVGPSGTIKTAYNKTEVSFTLTEKTPLRLMFYKANVTSAYWDTITVQLEVGSNATAYEPYSGNSYAVSWESAAGTVYGGALDLTAGLLTVTHGHIASYAGETLSGEWISDRDVYAAGTTPTTGAEVVYELAAPQTYQLMPTEITTLLGENFLWADTGDVVVRYRADPTLYSPKTPVDTSPYIVTLIPTALDYSGTMDHTVAEIYAAYQAGRRIVFRLMMGDGAYMEVDCSARWVDGTNTYPSFNAVIVDDGNDLIYAAYTSTTTDGTKATYGTAIYNLNNTQAITNDLKQALLQLANKVIYIDAHGQDYYDDLYDALYPSTEWTITNTLTHCSNSNSAQSVGLNAAYSATITADDHYILSTVTVTMGGTDVTSTVYSNGAISIASVTGNVVITATAIYQATSYSVTNTLSGCTTSNNAESVEENTSYSATITASAHYTLTGATVSVTMGGTDITSSAYAAGVISIASVTGNIEISVTAVAVYTIENTLTGCTSNNAATSAVSGSSYSATITATSGNTLTGATVSITMGGVDITATAYNAGAISIASVTANVSITITAVAVVLSSISAVYTQSGTVYENATLDSLKTDLVVTATYSDTTTATVPSTDYTLSGTLTVGTSTVTVTYGGKTDTFTVTVTAALPWKVLSVEDDFTTGRGLNNIAPGYTSTNASRTAYAAFDLLVDYGYTYTVGFGSSAYNIAVVSYYNGVADYVSNSENIPNNLASDSGWKTNGYSFTPPSNIYCVRFVLNASKSTLINAGVTTVTITREAT